MGKDDITKDQIIAEALDMPACFNPHIELVKILTSPKYEIDQKKAERKVNDLIHTRAIEIDWISTRPFLGRWTCPTGSV